MNKSFMSGRFTSDPELRHTDSGTAVCSFSLAVERRFKDMNGNKVTDFFDFVAWKGTAEFICNYFTKGRRVMVECTPQVREWTNKEGERRRNVEFIVENVEFADSRPTATESGYETIAAEDDLPF